MGKQLKERSGFGCSCAASTEGGEPRQRRAGSGLRWFHCREFVATRTGTAGGAVRFSASRARSSAGEQEKPTSALLARPMLRRSREPRRATKRQIIAARVERTSRLCVLIIQSCRERSIGSCRRISETSSCDSERLNTAECAARVQSCLDNARTPRVKTQDCSEFPARQLTNRRMRTFIATPSARNVNNTEDPP